VLFVQRLQALILSTVISYGLHAGRMAALDHSALPAPGLVEGLELAHSKVERILSFVGSCRHAACIKGAALLCSLVTLCLADRGLWNGNNDRVASGKRLDIRQSRGIYSRGGAVSYLCSLQSLRPFKLERSICLRTIAFRGTRM